MSILTRFANRLWPRRLARELEDEVEFHIAMRTSEHLKAGMSAGEATQEARQQFGDIDAVIADMRKERLAPLTLFTMTVLVVAVVLIWVAEQRIGSTDLRMPAAPAAPLIRDPDRPSGFAPPPPPGRGPTWEQYVKQANAFKALQQGPGVYSPRQGPRDKPQTP